MNNNELAESQVQNIRDEPELRSTAVHKGTVCVCVCVRVCVCVCVCAHARKIVSRKYLNMKKSSREEHPLR